MRNQKIFVFPENLSGDLIRRIRIYIPGIMYRMLPASEKTVIFLSAKDIKIYHRKLLIIFE